MQIITTKRALRSALAPRRSGTIGFAPTMGFLHEGHVSLFRKARTENDTVVASIFVNPTQFGANEDLDRYPRDPDGDSAKCRDAGVDLLWMPETPSVYARDHSTTVHVAGVTDGLCGTTRPTHFDGVATVVAKLLNLVQPDRAYFGEKDYQQLAVIRRMVRDLDMPVSIVGMPIVREPDGLAMSSRNAYLRPDERRAALRLSAALEAADAAFGAGEREPHTLLEHARAVVDHEPLVRLDYLELVDPDSLEPLSSAPQEGARPLLAIAAWVGTTRLIDNRRIGVPALDDPGPL